MRFACFYSVILLFPACITASAHGSAVSASLLAGDAPRAQQWETIAIDLSSPGSGGTISIHDLRGGLTVSRPLPDATSTSPVHILLPLPFIAPAQLVGDRWPVEVMIASASGNIQKQSLVVALPAVARNPTFRIAVLTNEQILPSAKISELPVTMMTVSQEDLLNGPPLIFASCDAVIIPGTVLEQMTDERLAGLLAAGVHLMAQSSSRPSALDTKGWLPLSTTSPSSDGTLWSYGSPVLPPLRALEPGLEKVSSLAAPTEIAASARWIALLIVPAALLVLFLVRGLFRNRAAIAAVLIMLMPAAAFACIAFLRTSAPVSMHSVSWTTDFSPPSSLRLTEQFKAFSAPFAQAVDFDVEEPGVLSLVTTSPRRYFALADAVLSLDLPGKTSLTPITRLHLSLADRSMITCAERTVGIAKLPASAGNPLAAGYVSTPTGSILFSQWADNHPEIRDSLLAWYELRFNVTHRYELSGVKPAPAHPENADFAVTDVGLRNPIPAGPNSAPP